MNRRNRRARTAATTAGLTPQKARSTFGRFVMIWPRFFSLPLVWFLLVWSWASVGGQALEYVPAGSAPQPLARYVEFLEDRTGTLTIQEVSGAETWRKPDRSLSMGFSSSTFWFRFTLANEQPARDLVLEFLYASLDHVDFFYRMPDGAWARKQSGRLMPFRNREIQDKNIVFRVPPAGTGPPREVYLRLESESAIDGEMILWEYADFVKKSQGEYLFLGLFFGVLLIMAIYNLFLFFALRDANYLFYTLYVGTFLLFQAGLNGVLFQYATGDFPEFSKQLYLVALIGTPVSIWWFSRSFLNLPAHVPRLSFCISALAILMCVTLLVGLLTSYTMAMRFVPPLVLVLAFLLMFAAVRVFLAGYKPARYYLLGWSGLLLVGTAWTLSRMALIPPSVLTEKGMLFASMFEVLMLSLALGDRYNLLRLEKERTQKQALESKTRLLVSVSRFVPNEFLRYLGRESVEQIRLGDAVRREMTILFADIRSFTSLSEAMTPEETFQFLNAFYRRIGPLIRNHRGFIDKYMGDGIMALFPESPGDALDAAVQMCGMLQEYNERRAGEGYDTIRIGIGIHTGSLMLGTIGETERMEGTVIADAVNLASRMEGLTKVYGATVLISEQTFVLLRDPLRYNLRTLDRASVKGKKETVSVIEVLDGDVPARRDSKLRTLPEFKRGVSAWVNGDFARTIEIFEKITAADPEDLAAALYLERARVAVKEGR